MAKNSNERKGQKGQEGDIVTKKGFLISLPGKKSAGSTESSINLAKPASSGAPADKGAGQGGQGHGGKRPMKKRHGGKGGGADRNGAPQGEDKRQAPSQQTPANQSGKQQPHKGDGKKPNDNRQRDDRRDKNPDSRKGQNPERRDGDFTEDRRGDRPSKKHDRRRGKGGQGGKGFDKGREDRQANQGGQGHQNARQNGQNNGQGGHNGAQQNGGRKQTGNGDRGAAKPGNIAPLSTLSTDISLGKPGAKVRFGKMTEDVPATSPMSLEEKFRDAKPLAQQIAEQEMRAKGIKIPEDGTAPETAGGEQQEIVGVRFKEAGKIYYFDPEGKQIPFGTPVIVETARGSEYGFIAISNRVIPAESLSAPLKKIERIATQTDTQNHIANKELEKDAEIIFREKVEKLGLEMNLICVEYTFDNSRLLFYFTAESRVDFRELVKELASVFRTRIELRQVGDRDEAKILGGLGVCGRASCCSTFLGEFAQISIKMAKDQSLSLNAAKISGSCGKLMCCLRYEDSVYEKEGAITPKIGSIVDTPEGRGHVTDRHVLTGIVGVKLDAQPEAPAKPFSRDEVTVIGFDGDKGEKDDGDIPDDLKDSE